MEYMLYIIIDQILSDIRPNGWYAYSIHIMAGVGWAVHLKRGIPNDIILKLSLSSPPLDAATFQKIIFLGSSTSKLCYFSSQCVQGRGAATAPCPSRRFRRGLWQCISGSQPVSCSSRTSCPLGPQCGRGTQVFWSQWGGGGAAAEEGASRTDSLGQKKAEANFRNNKKNFMKPPGNFSCHVHVWWSFSVYRQVCWRKLGSWSRIESWTDQQKHVVPNTMVGDFYVCI